MSLRPIPEDSALLVIDVQERLAAAMPEAARDAVITNAARLVRGARLLEIPVLLSEQYPKGLGATVTAVRTALAQPSASGRSAPASQVLEKVEFDACANAEFDAALQALARRTLVVAGMEAHVCVWQTVRTLRERGLDVHVATDATCSREPDNRHVAAGLWANAGATVSSTETVLFDWLGSAAHAAFRDVSRVLR